MYSKVFSEETEQFILKNYKGVGPSEMRCIINSKWGTDYTPNQLKGFYGRNHLNSGVTGYFEKGSIPFNKGTHQCAKGCEKTQFKAGHMPKNWVPVGTVLKKGDGYLWKKVKDEYKAGRGNWEQLHRIVWKEHNGEIPKNHLVIFRDGNTENCDIKNLMLITRGENAVLNRWKLNTKNSEYAETGLLIARIRIQQAKRKKRRGSSHGDK